MSKFSPTKDLACENYTKSIQKLHGESQMKWAIPYIKMMIFNCDFGIIKFVLIQCQFKPTKLLLNYFNLLSILAFNFLLI